MNTDGLRLLWIGVASGSIAAQLTADRTVVNAKLSSDLTQANAQVMTGV